MTPKEKAQELLKKMLSKNPNIQDGISRIDTIQAKLCALISVDEILFEIIKYADNSHQYVIENTEFWQRVKEELQKL